MSLQMANQSFLPGLDGAANEKITLSVLEAAQAVGVSRPTMLQLVHTKGFPSFRVGRKILIPRQGLIDWVERQGAEGAATQ